MDQSVRSIDVTTVGEVLIDFVAPEATNLTGATSFMRSSGGAPANVAVAVSRLGGRSAFVGAVGLDPFGEYLKSVFRHHGVNIRWLRTVREPTTVAFVARNTGERPDFVFYRGADTVLRPEDVRDDLLRASSYLHVSSLALTAEPSGAATRTAVERARQAGAAISFDPNLRLSSWPSLDAAREGVAPLMEAADVVKVNDEEARLLTGQAELEEAIGALGRPESLALITLGKEGCMWRWHGEIGTVAAPDVDVVDTTGVGDAFVGGILAELAARGHGGTGLAGLTPEKVVDVVRFAAAAGSLACTRTGAMSALPTRPEVEALLR